MSKGKIVTTIKVRKQGIKKLNKYIPIVYTGERPEIFSINKGCILECARYARQGETYESL